MGEQILCITDRIKCFSCQNTYEVGKLIPRDGYAIEAMDGSDKAFQQILYYCPCGNKKVLVYNPGNGNLVLAQLSAEPVPSL